MQDIVWPEEGLVPEDGAGRFEALDRVIERDYPGISGIVVVKNGAAVFERCRNGQEPDEARHVASVTKSVVSALVGIALDAGFLKSTEQRVLDFFPEFPADRAHAAAKTVTLRDLLTMTVPYPFEKWREPLKALCTSPDWAAYTLGQMGKGGAMGDFQYCTAGAHLLSVILSRATGQSARAFANDRLFAPLGMRRIPELPMTGFGYEELFGSGVRGWVSDPAGCSAGGFGLTLTPRDMARFGYLYLNGGKVGGRQVLSKSWIEASTAMNRHRYGYLWWLFEEDGLEAYAALGDGGNAIFCVPQKDLVVAVASQEQKPRNRFLFIKKHVLKAVR